MTATARWILFCEGARDAASVALWIDELLRLHGADWVRQALETNSENVRSWWEDHDGGASVQWFDLHRCYELARTLGVTVHQGHFGEEAQRPGALMLDTIFRITRRLHRRAGAGSQPSALVVLWDADAAGPERREGLEQALAHGALPPESINVVVGLPDPEREAWVLAGFEPAHDEQRARLERCRANLGYFPDESPHRLSAGKDSDKGDSKRILRELGIETWEEEQECIRIQDEGRRQLLSKRGAECGLAAWLSEVEAKLLSQVDGSIPARLAGRKP